MLLYRIHLNPRCKEVRRDLADPYQMHATLCRAFFPEGVKCPPGELLWRLEPETDTGSKPRVLIQCCARPEWARITPPGWLAWADPGINLTQKLSLDTLVEGQGFRFRLRANPCKTVEGKRRSLTYDDAQREWLVRKGKQHGFILPEPVTFDYFEFMNSSKGRAYQDVRITHKQMIRGWRHDGNVIWAYSVLFEGRLKVTDVVLFKTALKTGIGHGKVMGLGLLSVVPVSG